MFLSNLSIKRPVVATVMMLALVTLGVFSWRRLPIDMMPDVEFPVLAITTELPGSSPESVEREVTRKIEEAVNPIAGVKHVQSVSREGLSTVIVEFNLEVKINDVSQEARAKINAIRRELPETMKEPVIQKFDANSTPIVSLAVRSTLLGPRDLTKLADRKIKRRLESLPGVAKAKLVGAAQREVAIDLDPARLESLGMGVDEVMAGLAGENVDTPLGRLTRGASEMPLRISGKPTQAAAYAAMTIARRNGQPIRLGDVADVVDTVEEQRSLALVNGEPAVAIDITKQTKANTVAVVDAVKKTVGELRQEMPAGTEIQIVRDSSVFIREAVDDVQTTLVLGALLTVLIVFCFLNSWRSTVITGLTLPISVVASFIVMYFLNMTLNMLTLMALSLAIGLLIDDAIVVRENIVRHLERGEDHFTAAREGTSEIGLAVLATSMSIIAVFIPVAFMKGVVGRFFFQFGLTVAFAVLVSLFVSFTLDPMLSSRWHDPDIQRRGRRNPVQRALDRFNRWFETAADGYKRVIGWALDHRGLISLGAAGAFVAGLGIFAFGLQSEFMTPMDHGELAIRFRTAPGSSIAESRGRLEQVLKALGEFPEVRYTYATIGAGDSDTVRDGNVLVKLSDKSERQRSLRQFLHDARTRLEKIPGVSLSLLEDPDAWQKPLQVAVRGDDIPALKRYAGEIKQQLYTIPGVVDIDAPMAQDLPEYRLTVDREHAAAVGLGTAAVSRTVGMLVGGQAVTTYEDEDGESIDLRLRLPERLRQDVTQIGDLRITIPGATGPALAPLADLVTFSRSTSPAEIGRRDLSRQIVVDANLDGLPLGTAGALATQAAARVPMGPGYRLVLGGDTEIMVESFQYLGEALLLAIIFVYLILAAQFESFIDPLSIMLSLPLSIVGMAGMLFLTGDTISIMSLIGLIMLMGLVTKNAILLVDYTKVLRARGLERREALILAGRTRLRPILMTTSAMIFGMLPLFFALGKGAEFRAPMARAVVGGLITSTLLTLIVVPVVYTFLDDFAAWIRRRWTGGGKAVGDEVSPQTRPGVAALTVLVAVAGIALASPAGAQPAAAPPPSGPLVLTLDDALRLGLAQNREVKKAEEFQRWVHGKYVEERAGALPRFSLTGSLARVHDASQQDFFKGLPAEFGDVFTFTQNLRTAELGLTQTVFTWGEVGAAIRAARYGIASAEDQLREARQTTSRDVTAAFYDVLLARELQAIARQNLEQRQRHLDETRHRLDLGTATDYDVLAAQVAVDNARPDVIRSDNAVRVTRQSLRFLLAEERDVDATGSLDTEVAAAPAYDEVLATAIAHRSDLAALEHQVEVRTQLVRIAGAGDKPRLDLQAGFGRRRIDLTSADSSGGTWRAGLYFSFPIFDGLKARGQVVEAQSDLDSLRLDEARLRDAISLDVRTALDAVEEAGEILRALSGTVAQAERLLAMAEQGYTLGLKTHLEVQDAQLNLSTARGNLARARHDYLVARTRLEYVQGTLGG